MAAYKLSYGDRKLSFKWPSRLVKGILEGKDMPQASSEGELVQEALEHPVDSLLLEELVSKGEKACIIVGDMTRLWVRHHILMEPLLDSLNAGGIADRDIFVISATGDHRSQSAGEHRLLVGDNAYRRIKVLDHNSRGEEDLVFLGSTAFGTPVWINKNVSEADRVILTGGIVYHFLAGWGGGKKAVIPGVAGYETIMKNHSLGFNPEKGMGLNPEVRAGEMEHNPCSVDMLQGAEMLAPDFLVNTVLNQETGKIAAVVAGNYLTAHKQGCAFVEQYSAVDITETAEVVIVSCGGYPKDINLYQAYKTLYNASFALQKGGTILLLSENREGLGNEDFAPIINDHSTSFQREEALREKYTIGGHMAYHFSHIAEENDLLLLGKIAPEVAAAAGMVTVNTLEESVDFIHRKHGGLPPAYIIPHGNTTFPRLVQS